MSLSKKPERNATRSSPSKSVTISDIVITVPPAEPSEMSDIEETFEVEAVAGIKKNFRKKTVEVYIKWKGQPRSKSSWEDLDGANCEELLEPFKKGIKRLKGQIKLDPDSEDETEEPLEKDTYEVEDVIGVMWDFDYGGIMYYIKWKGWENKWNNWEPEDNVSCPVFTDFFQESADFLRDKYGKKKRPPKRRFTPETSTSAPSAGTVTPEVSDSDDDEPVSRRPGPKSAKKAGPKSKTAAPGPASSKRPGPKSVTSKPGPKSVTSRPGPKSATSKPGPMSKKAGPKSRTNGSSKSKHFSDSDDDSDKESSEKVSNGSSKRTKSDDSDEESVSSTNKRPGPKSRVGPASSKPGPMSKKKPGPRSKVGGGDDESDSD